MRLCLFEDRSVDFLEPLTLTRPAFLLRCGAATLLQRHCRVFQLGLARAAHEVSGPIGVLVRPFLTDWCRQQLPALQVNDAAWLGQGPTIYVNARWYPGGEVPRDFSAPNVGMAGDQIAYIVAPPRAPLGCAPAQIEDWLNECRDHLPQTRAGGVLFNFLWDIVDHNAAALEDDWQWALSTGGPVPPELAIVGPTNQALVAEGATIEPFVTADTRNGPVLIAPGAHIQSFTRLEGPCSVGANSLVLGAKVRGGTTIGPWCRVGGEIEASIMLGYANKYHDGFLGHSYLGEWVNLAAGTQTSDLRNDYGPVKVWAGGRMVGSGRTKVGSYFGDHTKTALGALLNTGSHFGAFCNVLPGEGLLPRVVPSYCEAVQGRVQERRDLREILNTAATVMRRRGQELTEVQRNLYYDVFDQTALRRQQVLREAEMRKWRKSV